MWGILLSVERRLPRMRDHIIVFFLTPPFIPFYGSNSRESRILQAHHFWVSVNKIVTLLADVYQMDKWLNMQRKVIIERTKVARIEMMKLIGRKRAADCTHFFVSFGFSFVWKRMRAIHAATMPPVIVSTVMENYARTAAIRDTTRKIRMNYEVM